MPGPGDLTLEQATQLQQDLICGYSTKEFQRKLRDAWNSSQDIVERTRLKMEVCLEVQGPVLSRYGFEASRKGVQQSVVTFRRCFNQDPTVAYYNEIMQRLVDPESCEAWEVGTDAPQQDPAETEEERQVREEREAQLREEREAQEREEEQRAREREAQAREWQEFATRRRAEEERRRKERERRWRLEQGEDDEEQAPEEEPAPAAGLPAREEEEVKEAPVEEDEEARYLAELAREDLLRVEASKQEQGDAQQEPCAAETEGASLWRGALEQRQEQRRSQRATLAAPSMEESPEWEDPTDAFCRRQMAGARGRLRDEVARAQHRERRTGELGVGSGFALVDGEATEQEAHKEPPSMSSLLASIDREDREDLEFEEVKHLLPGLGNWPPPEAPEPVLELLPLEDRVEAHRSMEPGAIESRAEWYQVLLEEEQERFRQKREAQERLLRRKLREQGKDTFVEAAPRNLKIGGTASRTAQPPGLWSAGVPEQPSAAGHHSFASGSHGAGKKPPGAQRHRPAEKDPAKSADRREWMAKRQERLRQRRLHAEAQQLEAQHEASGPSASAAPQGRFAWRRGKERGVLAEEAPAKETPAEEAEEDDQEEVIDLE